MSEGGRGLVGGQSGEEGGTRWPGKRVAWSEKKKEGGGMRLAKKEEDRVGRFGWLGVR